MIRRKKTKNSAPAATRPSDEIHFYRANEKPYGAFSNLFKSPIQFEDRIYPTAEHAYQAGKAQKPKVREWILAAPSPSLAAMAAHGLYTWDVVANWNEIKFDRMRRILLAKFTQHPHLFALLLSTGNKRLVEAGTTNNAVNRLWGEVNGVGQNMLGKMLMELRESFREKHGKGSLTVLSKKAVAVPNNRRKTTRKAKAG